MTTPDNDNDNGNNSHSMRFYLHRAVKANGQFYPTANGEIVSHVTFKDSLEDLVAMALHYGMKPKRIAAYLEEYANRVNDPTDIALFTTATQEGGQ